MPKVIQKYGRKASLAAVAAVAATGNAMAAVPANVTTAMGDGATDSAAVAALALLIIIGIAVIKYMRRSV